MEDYKPNSHRFREEQGSTEAKSTTVQKVEQVAKGNVKVKKKGEMHKFKDIFIAEDITNVKSYVIEDIVVPLIKKTICDIFNEVPNMLFWGKTGRGKSTGSSYVSYRDYSKRDDGRPKASVNATNRFDYNDLIFDRKEDALAVREQMEDIIASYGFVTVAAFYEMADPNLTPPYTSNRYGWMNIRNAEIIRVREGFILKLPRAVPID